jgi:hypothetical protein
MKHLSLIFYNKNILFWKNKCISECALQSQFPLLYDLASDKNIIVAQVI